jgi:hypothetical protein
MSGRIVSSIRLALAALLATAIATPATAHPPWLTIEWPANPYAGAARGAFLVVHAYPGPAATHVMVTGTAEGVVNGERRTISLELVPTEAAATYAVRKAWPSEGVWVLRFTLDEGNAVATALVGIGDSGEVRFVRVPTGRQGYPRAVADAEISQLLRSLAG